MKSGIIAVLVGDVQKVRKNELGTQGRGGASRGPAVCAVEGQWVLMPGECEVLVVMVVRLLSSLEKCVVLTSTCSLLAA